MPTKSTMTTIISLSVICAALAACGGPALTRPESLPEDTFLAGQPIELTLIMKSCSDTCSEYDAASCGWSLHDHELDVSVSVPYHDKPGADRTKFVNCGPTCGAPVFAHCTLGKLDAGTYTLKVDAFSAPIYVESSTVAAK
jgi:hypothetical protein